MGNTLCFIRVSKEFIEQIFIDHYVPGAGERVENKIKSVWDQIRGYMKMLSTRLISQHTFSVFTIVPVDI